MKLAIAVFLERCEKKKRKKLTSPQMTINECEGKSRNRASRDYAALKFSLNLCLFSAQGFPLTSVNFLLKHKQTKSHFWLRFSFVFTVFSVHINNYFVVSNPGTSDYIFQTGHAFVVRGCSEPTQSHPS